MINDSIAKNADKAQSPTIEVLELRSVEGMGSLRAFGKVQVGDFILHACRVVQQDGQRPYAQLPMSPASGNRKGYFPVVTCHVPHLDQKIKRALVDAWEARREVTL
jgi:hypothetical protein